MEPFESKNAPPQPSLWIEDKSVSKGKSVPSACAVDIGESLTQENNLHTLLTPIFDYVKQATAH